MRQKQVHMTGIRARLKSFHFAFRGIHSVFQSQQNFRIHTVAALLVLLAGILLRVSALEWCILLLSIGLVMAMEAMNSAVEKLVDHVSPGFNREAGMVKDMAAGAVLLTALAAGIAGFFVFIPKVLSIIF